MSPVHLYLPPRKGYYADPSLKKGKTWQQAQFDHIDALLEVAGVKKAEQVCVCVVGVCGVDTHCSWLLQQRDSRGGNLVRYTQCYQVHLLCRRRSRSWATASHGYSSRFAGTRSSVANQSAHLLQLLLFASLNRLPAR